MDFHSLVSIRFDQMGVRNFSFIRRCNIGIHHFGFTPEEMDFFNEFLHSNAHLLYRYAAQGGIHCA